MNTINPLRPYIVQIVEYERGWGSKVDSQLDFSTEQEARDYEIEYNKKHNNEKIVPDWYMVAQYVGKFA